jgi:uncharacterized damage-inducible protein DinB
MTQIVVQAIWKNYKNTFGIIHDTITNFDDEKWRKESTWFQVPVRVARHTIECVDFYFKEKGSLWSWEVSRFGRPYWETPNDEQPSQTELLVYLDELVVRVEAYFSELQDEELGEIYDDTAEPPSSTIAHLLYALRHTVHHIGSLVALADLLGVPSGDWDTWA